MTSRDSSAAHTSPARDLLVDGFERIRDGVPGAVDGLSADDLLWRPDADANHIAWLLWHLARQQDDQVAGLAEATGTGDGAPVWRSGGWAERFALPYSPDAHGWGMTSAEVGAFTVADPMLFAAYHSAVHARTVALVDALTDDDYEQVVDEAWDPPVTVAVRLVSVLDDAAKHLGQAQYVKGLVERRR